MVFLSSIINFLSCRVSQGVRCALCMLLACLWVQLASAQQPAATVVPSPVAQAALAPVLVTPERGLPVPSKVGAFSLPLAVSLDPEAIWQASQPITQAANAQGVWTVNAGQRSVAKFTLSAQDELISTLELPLVRLDKADVFWRTPGQSWKHAQAGDTRACWMSSL
jgi:hypothetical protein